jgi:hypothetical protein
VRFGYGADADQPAQAWCTHATCREDQALDLAFMGAALNREDLRALADAAHQSTVRCRLQPRKGAIRAPFPPQKVHSKEQG